MLPFNFGIAVSLGEEKGHKLSDTAIPKLNGNVIPIKKPCLPI